ncbi:MAG: helix-turn-helix transcriptional regulator [Flaviflexus sp.]|nr:helix-turn-helix transcriptional regulator [Flaviflexus sp.]
MPTIIDNIAHAIESRGLSQRDLAELTEISQPTLSRILSGRRPVKAGELIAIAEATGASLEALLDESDLTTRVQYAARADGSAGMEAMRTTLLQFCALDAFLDEHLIEEAR